MIPLIIGDDQLRSGLGPAAAVAAMCTAMTDAERGTLITPPRLSADLGPGRLVFTPGARPGDWFGYRSYDKMSCSAASGTGHSRTRGFGVSRSGEHAATATTSQLAALVVSARVAAG